jgi:hypothetical protein
VESNQIDVVAATVFRDFEEVVHIFETRTSRQVLSDVGQTDRLNRIHFDLTLIHAVAAANLDVGTCPYADTASDGASSHSLSESLGEDHAASLRPSAQLMEERVRRMLTTRTAVRSDSLPAAVARKVEAHFDRHRNAGLDHDSVTRIHDLLRPSSGVWLTCDGRFLQTSTKAAAVRCSHMLGGPSTQHALEVMQVGHLAV